MPPALAQLPTVNLPNVQLCKVGRWNGHDYTQADLAAAVENARALSGTWAIPLTLGHDGESQLGDGAPALGWVSNIRLEGDALYGDYVKVPEKLAQLIASGAYAKRSCTFLVNPEIDGQRRQGLVLQNVALLGAQTPAVDGLEDIFPLYNKRRLTAAGGEHLTLSVPLHLAGNEQALLDYWLPKVGTPGWFDDCVDALTGKVDDPNAVCGWIKAQKNTRSNTRGARRMDIPRRFLRALLGRGRAPLDETVSTTRRLAAGSSYDSIRAAVQAALNAQYSPSQPPSGDDGAASGNGTPTPSSTIVMLFGDSVVVNDDDEDSYFEIPYTMSGNTAQLGAPQQVELVPKPVGDAGTTDAGSGSDDAGASAGGDGDAAGGAGSVDGASDTTQMSRILGHFAAVQSLSRKHELDPEVEALVEPVTAAVMRLAAAPVDSDVERLVTEMSGDLDTWLQKLNSIATGKAGVTQMRTLLNMLKSGLAKFNVTDSGSAGSAGSAKAGSAPAAPATAAAKKNHRQEDPDVKLSQLARRLGLPETASEADIEAALPPAAGQSRSPAPRGDSPLVIQLASDVARLSAEAQSAKTRTLLDTAQREGRLTKPLRERLERLARDDYEQVEQIVGALPVVVDYAERGKDGDVPHSLRGQLTPGAQEQLRRMNPGAIERLQRDTRSLAEKRDAALKEAADARLARRVGTR